MFGADSLAGANRDYQGRLADSLIGALGFESAVHTCLANGWDGVLQQVLSHRTLSPDLVKSPSAVK